MSTWLRSVQQCNQWPGKDSNWSLPSLQRSQAAGEAAVHCQLSLINIVNTSQGPVLLIVKLDCEVGIMRGILTLVIFMVIGVNSQNRRPTISFITQPEIVTDIGGTWR